MARVPFFSLEGQLRQLEPRLTPLIDEVLSEGQFIGGKYVEKFEQEFAAYLGAGYCVTCGNGTDALEIVLKVLGIGDGDEVIVPTMSWISTALAVVNVGATPIFVDVKLMGCSIDPDLIESRITKRTKVILPVHLYGYPAEMDEINRIAQRHGIYVVEDAAQAHGSEYKGVKAGNLGDIATFSFYPTKNLGCFGDGGAIVTSNAEWASKARLIANYGDPKEGISGRNSRLDSLQAAILSLKLEFLDEWNDERKEQAKMYEDIMQSIPDCSTINPEDWINANHHIFPIFAERRDELRINLRRHGLETGLHYPSSLPQLFRDISDNTNANFICDKQVSLPIYPRLDMMKVISIFDKVKP